MGLRERFRDFARTPMEQEADELREQSFGEGGDDLTALAPRYPACVCGTVRTVTLPPRRSVPALVAEVWDGKGSVNLIWVGRRAIGGIQPGTFVRARGRVATFKGVPTIFNPAYEIIPKQ
ncbi:OB-fold nucleic acid binding domain-containing protein [Phycicoccus flavus]|uniref:OB-fold nucleic acid binding domain-containing protein n=1 Tax=Phycicoccus flavus TaxID=2502783 RepID=UPI000FEB65CC|nr:OB-fold nucleic acid binding domain-containing protein [Phycicoccus flavus]NHA69586.1 OB-fold nucleic acid binding domain-containing protein [Phycicoccus flavus]